MKTADNTESAQVRKFFAICTKSTCQELAVMHGILSTFLTCVPGPDTSQENAEPPDKPQSDYSEKIA